MKLKIGDKAPVFKAYNQHNELLNLKDFKGQKIVLIFYPKDSTPTCTKQLCNIRDHFEEFLKAGYKVLAISTNSAKSHQNFASKNNFHFDLIVDENAKINELYGVWREKTLFGHKYMGTVRTSFLLDEKGKIIKIIEKVKAESHTEQILND